MSAIAGLSRSLLVVVCHATFAACQECCIIDDWGTSGYARIEGTVTLANGTPMANSGVFVSCGIGSPGGFGMSEPTNAQGRYFADIDAPGPLILPANGELVCRVSAPNDRPPVVSVERSVPFSTTAETRPLTIIDLVEE